MITFRKTIDRRTTPDLVKQACIHGIRIFIEGGASTLTPNEFSNFSFKILNSIRSTYIVNQDFLSEWSLLPDYIQMIASIVVSGTDDIKKLELLKQCLEVLLKHYWQIPLLSRYKVSRAFLTVFHKLRSYKFFLLFLKSLVHQCVIWTCSHQHLLEVGQDNQEVRHFFIEQLLRPIFLFFSIN